MKKNIFIIVLIIIYISINVFFLIKQDKVVYLGNTLIEINKNDIRYKKYKKISNRKKVKIYFNDKFINGYIKTDLNENGKEYYKAIDLNSNYLIFNNDLIAHDEGINISIANYNEVDYITKTEEEKLSNYLSEEEIEGTIDKSLKVTYDIDNDSEYETIYSLYIVHEDKKIFMVILEDEDEFTTIEKSSGDYTSPALKVVALYTLIDFNNDKNYEIVVGENKGIDSIKNYRVFTYNGDIVNEIE